MLLLSLVTLLLVACNKKDLSPPPLNPHPKEALHVTVTFDNAEDAKRYSVVMKALYRTITPGCGYMDYFGAVGGIYRSPQGTFDIPNESRDPQHAEFNVYLDRYSQRACNWELAAPSFIVRDTYTGRRALAHWGSDEDLTPGTEYKAVCQFKVDDFPQTCYGRSPMPDIPHYSLVPITVRVSESSAKPRQ